MKKLLLLFLLNYIVFALDTYTHEQKIKYLYPLGKKIATTSCNFIQKQHFKTILELHTYITKHCPLEEQRYYDALTYYLWDNFHLQQFPITFHYTKHTKCPVCGMFIYKYPSWATMMQVGTKKYYFDGVKDMMKFYFSHTFTNTIHLYARDYYTKKIFELHKAFFVIGSNIYGPMGDELIPFKNKNDAKTFLHDHFGKIIINFSHLNKKMVESLDE